MSTIQLPLPPKLIPVFTGPALYRGAYGGRGSAKTRSFALMSAVRAYMWAAEGRSGLIVCGREFMNSLAESSFAEISAAIRDTPWLTPHFDIGAGHIRTSCGRIAYSFTGLRHNLDSIKSKARILLLWVDEAEAVSETAWVKAIPTVREEGAEIWVTWNPERKQSATHQRFRAGVPEDARIVELNWRDNPWFPPILDRIRRDDLASRPEQYDWIWEGGFRTVVEGAYYAAALAQAKSERRIDAVARDPLMRLQAFFDIGGTGATADAAAIWVAQFVGQKINVLDYYEAQGQPLAAHVAWLRERGYASALIHLPHDGAQGDKVFATSYEGALRQGGFDVIVIPNQGRGAAKARIETARRIFPKIWFHADTTTAGREALGWYHEKRSDDDRNIGLGPSHDWSSHGSDAFGLMCIAYDEPPARRRESGRAYAKPRPPRGSWQAV